MTPDQKLAKVFELSALAKQLLRDGLRRRHPNASEEELHHLYLEQLAQCHNRNY
jgi:hypothetical protein